MTRLVLLNGPPGVGKSTLAGRYATAHPGTLCCDVDVLRTMVGGWQADYAAAGSLIRPAALGFITAYLRASGDVVLPQLIAREVELAKFERAAADAGADFVHVLLDADPATAVGRFEDRDRHLPHLGATHATVAADGGTKQVVADYHQALRALCAVRSDVVVVDASGDADATYLSLAEVLAR